MAPRRAKNETAAANASHKASVTAVWGLLDPPAPPHERDWF